MGQEVVHSVPVRANCNARDCVRGRHESFKKCMKKPDAKGDGANNSRGEGGCSYECRRSLDQLDSKYRKYVKTGLGKPERCMSKSLSVNELGVLFVYVCLQRRKNTIRM